VLYVRPVTHSVASGSY